GNNYNDGPRFGFHASWIIGGLIILFGVLRYFAHTQVNQVTGVAQHLSMFPSQEMSLGLSAAPRMAAQMGGEADPARDPGARDVTWRHSAQQMENGQLGQIIATGIGVGASSDRNGYAEAAAAQMANQMLQLHYSRDDESQADEYGMRCMSQAGYDPAQMLGVM